MHFVTAHFANDRNKLLKSYTGGNIQRPRKYLKIRRTKCTKKVNGRMGGGSVRNEAGLRIRASGSRFSLAARRAAAPRSSLLLFPVDPWHYETAAKKKKEEKYEAGRISHSFFGPEKMKDTFCLRRPRKYSTTKRGAKGIYRQTLFSQWGLTTRPAEGVVRAFKTLHCTVCLRPQEQRKFRYRKYDPPSCGARHRSCSNAARQMRKDGEESGPHNAAEDQARR